ncbi:MAG: hypothetical protein R6V06_03940, partial [Kiritimatiellia bacterium]
SEHPITEGLEDFKIFDELYAKLQGDEEIEVLVEADSDWSGQTEPLVFVRPYGIKNPYSPHGLVAIKSTPVAKNKKLRRPFA